MIFDIILIIILAGFVLKGFRLGFIEGVGSIVGIIVGLIVAANYYLDLAEALPWLFLNNESAAKILCFLFIFIIVNRAIALVFWVFDKMFKLISFIPFLKTFNRLLGGILGFIEGLLIIGIIFYLLINFTTSNFWTSRINQSKLAKFIQTTASVVTPLIPDGNERLKNYLPNINFNQYNVPKAVIPDIEDLLK